MSSTPSATRDVAESIVEHAQAMARLEPARMAATAHAAARAAHRHAIRLLALPYMDPQPDREFVRALRATATGASGVFVQLGEGAVRLVVDGGARQHRLTLWNRQQFLRGEEDEDEDDAGGTG